MGLYCSDDDVKARLRGKVSFTDDEADENRMTNKMLKRLIHEAEAQLEHDLSPRYAAPFQTKAGSPFKELPARPTREVLRTMAEIISVIRVLETDFGTGGATDGDKYTKTQQKRYDAMVAQLLKKKGENAAGWMYPPLPDLMLNYMNMEADDGFMGQVLTTSDNPGPGFAQNQVNDPSVTFWTGDFEE